MFQTVDLRLLRLASRFEDPDALDPAAPHRRELLALHRRELRALWVARLAFVRSWLAGSRPQETDSPERTDDAAVRSRPETAHAPSGMNEACQQAA